jgi:hypothetical protein
MPAESHTSIPLSFGAGDLRVTCIVARYPRSGDSWTYVQKGEMECV